MIDSCTNAMLILGPDRKTPVTTTDLRMGTPRILASGSALSALHSSTQERTIRVGSMIDKAESSNMFFREREALESR